MFCFLQLPYHPKSTVHVATRDNTTNRHRLYQYYSTEMTAEVMEVTRRHLGEMDQKRKQLLFRRSHSEPVALTNEGMTMTSRTDPEWNMTVDSISLQSSFVDYQARRKERLRKHQENMNNVMSHSSEASEHNEQPNYGEAWHVEIPSTLSLTDSDNSNSSNDITSSQAKEISYEEEMRMYIERAGHLVTNVFADPFDSDERKSRTEMWVEASTENLAEEEGVNQKEEEKEVNGVKEMEGREEDEGTGKSKELIHQSTEESLLSSNVTVSSLKKTTFTVNLKEAMETRSEIDVNEVDRFWDYLYDNDNTKSHEASVHEPVDDGQSCSDSNRSIGVILSPPVKVESVGSKVEKETSLSPTSMGKDEQDREVDEELEINDQTVETRFFELQPAEREAAPILMRTTSSQTSVIAETSGPVHFQEYTRNNVSSDKENRIRELSFKLSENLFKDLKVLLVERDRAKEAMEILPAKSMKELSEECNYFQTRYRVRIEQNKEKLDRRIDEVWRKLLKMPIESQEIIDFISVSHSCQLTVNARRNLPQLWPNVST